MQFVLEDEEYLLKYKSDLRDAVMRAKANPNSLLRGYHVCIAKHIHPSSNVLSIVIKSAGGNVSIMDHNTKMSIQVLSCMSLYSYAYTVV